MISTSVAAQPATSGVNASADVEIASGLADTTAEETVIVRLSERPENTIRTTAESNQISSMQTHAAATQSPFKRFADGNPHVEIKDEFWITNALVVTVDRTQIPLRRLGTVENVERIHENFEVEVTSTAAAETATRAASVSASSTDSYTWGLNTTNVPQTWATYGTRGQGVKVAVLDTGVDPAHPDIDIQTDNWKDFGSDNSSTPKDYGSHGTHVSGTIVGGNASGTYIGVAPESELWHGAVLTNCDSDGCTGSFAQIINGTEWAVTNDADVISMSLGGDGYLDDFIDPISNARQAGSLPVVSIGNKGAGTSSSPGNIYDSVAVGATNRTDNVASYSGGETIDTSSAWGSNGPSDWPATYPVPDIVAPGTNVTSSLPGGRYGNKSGTSMAAPHVSGVAALIISNQTSDLSPDTIETRLTRTAVDLNADQTRQGSGRLDAFAAVSASPAFYEVNITNITAPIVEGDELSIEYDVTNEGAIEGQQNITLTVDGVREDIDEAVSLNNGERYSGSLSYQTVSGDAPNVSVEVASEDTSETALVSINRPAFYNVTITNTTTGVVEGDPLTVEYNVTNTGDVAGTQNISFAVNGIEQAVEQDISLGSGERYSGSFSYQTVSGDAPNVSVEVASENTNETVTVPVSRPSEPAAYMIETIETNASEVAVNETVSLNATVRNTGNTAGSQSVRLFAGGNQVATRSVSLAPTASQTLEFVYSPPPGAAPLVKLEARTDNDRASVGVDVNSPEPAAFEVTLADQGHSITQGEPIANLSVAALITNTGEQAGVVDTVTFSLREQSPRQSGSGSGASIGAFTATDVLVPADDSKVVPLDSANTSLGDETVPAAPKAGNHSITVRVRLTDAAAVSGARTVRATPTVDYETIQSGVDAATQRGGGIVDVAGGAYTESVRVDTPDVRLVGPRSATLDSGGAVPAVRLNASGTAVRGLTIAGSDRDAAGVVLTEHADSSAVERTHISGFGTAVETAGNESVVRGTRVLVDGMDPVVTVTASAVEVSQNRLSPSAGSSDPASAGIALSDAPGVLISDNTIGLVQDDVDEAEQPAIRIHDNMSLNGSSIRNNLDAERPDGTAIAGTNGGVSPVDIEAIGVAGGPFEVADTYSIAVAERANRSINIKL